MSEEWLTRQTLLLRVKDKEDEHAWDDFVTYYEPFIKKIIFFLNVQENDRDDLSQEILIKLWKSLAGFNYDEKKGRFRTWLKTVIRNTTYDYFRKKKRMNERESLSFDEMDIKQFISRHKDTI